MHDFVRELRVIGEMQRHLLPREIPRLPGWKLAVYYNLGQWPGGNYYDFLPFPDGRLLFLVADASDQGGPAATLVGMIRVVMHSCPLSSGQERSPFCPLHGDIVQAPHIILGNLNRLLVENSLEEQYVRAFCGILNPVAGMLHFANAGHLSPRWWHARERKIEALRDVVGLPLGSDSRAAYHHKRVDIEPEDVLLFYTSGVTAALNPNGFAFGAERLDAALQDSAPDGAEAVKNEILTRLQDFLGEQASQDDMTLEVFERCE